MDYATVSRVKRRILKHVWVVRGFLIALLLSILGVLVFGVYVLFQKTPLATYTSMAANFVFPSDQTLNAFEGRTNLLILGKAGKGHEGGDLTDSMMVMSINLNDPGIVSVSIPRDIWIPEIRAKVNSAYYWGNQQQEGGGLILAKSTLEQIVGIPLHYGLVLDFSGLTRMIDVLGGVRVDVERSFVDEKYPIAGRENDLCGGDREYKCRYETVRFEAGPTFMDGTLALKYVRSRNAQGDEGTDLARSARQQRLIEAVKEKLMTPAVYLSPTKVWSIAQVVQESIETDMSVVEQATIARKVFDSRNKISSFVLAEEFLLHPAQSSRYDFQYVFIPKAGNWSQVHAWVKDLFQR
jgi:LCP family protein required for cell wall assembly